VADPHAAHHRSAGPARRRARRWPAAAAIAVGTLGFGSLAVAAETADPPAPGDGPCTVEEIVAGDACGFGAVSHASSSLSGGAGPLLGEVTTTTSETGGRPSFPTTTEAGDEPTTSRPSQASPTTEDEASDEPEDGGDDPADVITGGDEPEKVDEPDEDDRNVPAAGSGEDDDEGSSGALPLVLGILLGISAGAAAGWFAARRAGAADVAPAAGLAAAGAPGGGGDVAQQRAGLVGAAIAAIDLAQNEGLREQLTRALEQAGVRQLSVDGETFDAARHHAVDRLQTHDPSQHNTVITDRPGWIDNNQVLRLPDVIVYRAE
jgi:hypothetical protein